MSKIDSRRTTAPRDPALREGFSIVELMVVVVIMLIIAAFAIPAFLNMVHTTRLRGTASDFSGIANAARINAVQDSRFYSVYFLGTQGFVDIYPKSNTGVSGSGGTVIDPRDPQITLSGEVVPIPAANAPATAVLYAQFLPPNAGLVVNDGSPGTGTPITFGPRGLPCTSQIATGGTVCDSAGGATAFWVFLQNTISGNYEAITVSPSGRIHKWYYAAGGWNAI